ncbi:hypothetical protein Hypma_013117 [Hypsizygus marmoreus]|uniref:Uncharacterized protein n=1 Tax=Hypsizygus marmoreus TaxID=39966 RepID=A0A369JDS7_HYPMA|nr:hypothetical protein Hypma_013117 [Hypsizygus marmoreus]
MDSHLPSAHSSFPACNEKSQSIAEKGTEAYTENVTGMQIDGGPRAWASVVGRLLISLVSFGYANAFGVYQAIYTREAGKLMDLGYFRQTMLAGSIISLVSFFVVSLADHHQYYQIFLAQGPGMGIGTGLL